MKKIIYLLIGTLLVAGGACEKAPEELTVTINRAGNVNVKVIDGDKNGMQGANVSIYDTSDYGFMYSGNTNASGIYTTEKLLQGSYYFTASIIKGKITYQDEKKVQVTAGETKNIEMNPFINSGKVSIQVIDIVSKQPLSGLYIGLYPAYHFELSLRQYIDACHFYGKTNAEGRVIFTEVPVNTAYAGLFYDDVYSYLGLTYGVLRYPFYTDKEKETSIEYEIYYQPNSQYPPQIISN